MLPDFTEPIAMHMLRVFGTKGKAASQGAQKSAEPPWGVVMGAFRKTLFLRITSQASRAMPEVFPARYTFSPTSISSVAISAPAALIIERTASIISGPIPSPFATVIVVIMLCFVLQHKIEWF